MTPWGAPHPARFLDKNCNSAKLNYTEFANGEL